MKRIIIVLAVIAVIVGISLAGLYLTRGYKFNVEGNFFVDTINPWDTWTYEITSYGMEEGAIFDPLWIGQTGFITIRGYLSPNATFHPEYSNEVYEAKYDTNRRGNTIFGSGAIPFKLEFNRIDLHGEGALWMDFSIVAYETSACIPFTDVCWGEAQMHKAAKVVTIMVGD